MTKTHYRQSILFLSLAAIFLFFQIFRLPFTPFLFEGDHSVHISNAWRMMTGDKPFQDFFIVTFPGTELYYLVLFKLFGVHQWLLNLTIFGLLISISALGLHFSRKFLTGWAVYLPVSIFLVIGFRTMGIDGSHRFFSVLFVLIAVAFIFERRNFLTVSLAGFFCGIASLFTQQRGAAAIAAIFLFLIIEKFYTKQSYTHLLKLILCLAAPFALIIGFTLTYFIVTAGFDNFYYSTFVFLVKHYPADKWNNFGAYLREIPPFASPSLFVYLKYTLPILFFYLLVPAVYLLFAVLFWRKRKTIEDDKKLQLILFNLVGIMIAAAIFATPTAARLYQVSIPALITLIWSFQITAIRSGIFPVILAFLGFLGISYTIQRQTVPAYSLQTPTGEIAFLSEEFKSRYEWVSRHTQPLDYLYEPQHPSLYAIFKLKNPTPMSWLRPNNFTPDKHVNDVIEGLNEHQPRYIIWNSLWNEIALENRSDFHLQPLIDYLQTKYHRVEILNNYSDSKEIEYKVEIWEINR